MWHASNASIKRGRGESQYKREKCYKSQIMRHRGVNKLDGIKSKSKIWITESLIGLMKETAVASTIGVADLAFRGNQVSQLTFKGIEVFALFKK